MFPRSLAQEGYMSPKMRYPSKGSTLHGCLTKP
jgi:hypothetical protein